MAVIVKTSNFAFLKKIGVEQSVIDKLQASGIKLSLGFKEFSFIGKSGEPLAAGALPASANDLVKGTASSSAVASACNVLTGSAVAAMSHAAGAPTPIFVPPPPTQTVSKVQSVADKVMPSIGIAAAHNMEPVALKDATMMYQRVRGTSAGSVYVVVAIGDGVKVAARCKSVAGVSIRVEGDLTPKMKAAFAEQAMSQGNGDYMSGHYTGSDKVTPARILGAVLAGSGVEFQTPFPSMAKVGELCK